MRQRVETAKQRYDFDVDMLLLQTFGRGGRTERLPTDIAVRIRFRAENEMTFLKGLTDQVRTLSRAGLL